MKKLHLGVDLGLRTLDELRQNGIREIMSTEDTIQPSSRNGNEARLFAIEASESQEAEPSGRPRLRRAPLAQVTQLAGRIECFGSANADFWEKSSLHLYHLVDPSQPLRQPQA